MNENLMKSWMDFVNAAAGGAEEARKMFFNLTPKDFDVSAAEKWFKMWGGPQMSGVSSSADKVKELSEVVNAWWSAMGMVPASQYQEALRHNRELEKKLRDARDKIARLSDEFSATGQEEAKKLAQSLEKTTREILDTQVDFVEKMAGAWFAAPGKDEGK